MSETPDSPALDTETILTALRRKESNWVQWGRWCQQLHEARLDPQAIFEATGFEPSRQNLFIVASQVYTGLEQVGAAEPVLAHFGREGSNVLYELRILSLNERKEAAEVALARKLDPDGARELAKAVKDFARINPLPAGFTRHPGDAAAYRAWQYARQTTDLRERSQLIARGLAIANSDGARQALEKLLLDFGTKKQRPAPRLPFYRLEASEELPRILPVAGTLPVNLADFKSLGWPEQTGTFQVIAGSGSFVALPGYQVLRAAEAPVAILATASQLPGGDSAEPVLIVVDREERDWQEDSYFLAETETGLLAPTWFAEAPEKPLYGRVILVMRPKRILDEEIVKDPWQTDE